MTRQGATGEMFIPINPETWSLNLQQMVYSRSQGKGMVKQGQGIYKGVGWGGVEGWGGGVGWRERLYLQGRCKVLSSSQQKLVC